MKKVYVDTNILIAAFMPEDPFFESSRKIYNKLGVDYEGYTSPLSLVEVAGVISSRLSEFPTELMPIKIKKKFQNLSSSEVAMLITYYVMSKDGLNLFHVPGDAKISLRGRSVFMPTILSHALTHSLKLSLRAFDSYHFATAYDLVHLYNISLSFLISNDRHFLKLKSTIGKSLDLTVISSNEFAQIERL
jgi:predicted nucleic acid-binding protein